jgi:hypothetical protein
MDSDSLSTDLARLPIRLEVELPPAVHEQLQDLSRTTGRSIDEVALELIDRALQQDT